MSFIKKSRDWMCLNCNVLIFGSKSQCNKCLSNRPIDNGSSDKGYDWTCPGCNMYMFGSKSHCLKCNIRNPILPINLKKPLANQNN